MSAQLDTLSAARQSAMADTPARRRIGTLLDADSFVELDGFARSADAPVGVVCGYGSVMGAPVAVFAQDASVQGGAVDAAHAAKIAKVHDLALKTGIPVVGIYDSHGARVSEGVGALAACGDMLRDQNNLSGVVPQIAVVLGTCAGLSALLACSADFLIMSEQAELFVAAPRDGASASAQAAAAAGVAHIVSADDTAALNSARTLISRLPINNLAASPVSDFAAPADSAGRLRAACENPETGAADVAYALCDDFSSIELMPAFGSGAFTAVATLGGTPCGVVSTKGRLDRDSCSKIARLVSVCDAYQLPVITLVNTEGLGVQAEGELCSSIRDMARMAHVYAEATTAKVAVITGAAYGAAYVALAGRAAGADYTVAWPSAVITALAPRTAVAFLHGDDITPDRSREQVEADYIAGEASPLTAAAGGYIDDVIDPALTRPAILSALDLLSAKRVARNPKKHGNIPL